MNEIDKMRKSELADMEKPEIQASFIHAKKLLAKMRTMTIYDEDFRQILEELVPNIPITSIIYILHTILLIILQEEKPKNMLIL